MIAALFGIFGMDSVSAAECITEETNWKEQAKLFLTHSGEAATGDVLNKGSLRCIKMNNYVCMMHSSSANPWNGSNGRHDCADGDNGHAVFVEAKWSVRAMVRDLCSKYRGRNRPAAKTALAIAEVRSPWCDTLGTNVTRGEQHAGGYARTCGSGPRVTDFSGWNKCEKPADGKPSASQCAHCNCPNELAPDLVRGLENYGVSDEHSDLTLFHESGELNRDVLSIYISNIIHNETGGFRPTQELLNSGFDISGSCKK